MGEFMGMDPAGVQALIRNMESGKSVLAGIRPGLEDAIREAGPDWAGTGGVTAMYRAWAFFHESQADLRWRLDLLSQVLPPGSPALTTVRVPFTSQSQAAAEGAAVGTALAKALDAHLAEGTHQSWAAVEEALAGAGPASADPAYAWALLAKLGGPERLRTIFGQWMVMHNGGPRRGLDREMLGKAQPSLGALAQAFAAAESSGRLPEEWRTDVLTRADPATLSTMVALSRPSGALLNEVALRQFTAPTAGFNPTSPDPDWNTVNVLGAYVGDPAALQRLLAEHRDLAGKLLHPNLAKGTGTPHFDELLADVLGRALDPHMGSALTRERAWTNLIDGVGYDGTEKLSGHYATFENSAVNQALARNLTPYLGQLALGQVYADSPELGLVPAGPWKGLHEDVAARFVGALMQDPATAKSLTADFQAYVRGLDVGQAHPFSADPDERAEFTRLSAQAGGLANLLLGGSTYAEFNDDEFIDMVADVALLPVNYTIARLAKDAKPFASTMIDYRTGPFKDELADVLKDHLDERTPETARVVAGRIIELQVGQVLEALKKHGHEPLTAEDQERLRQEFRGRMYPALSKALEKRGG
ncbi:hypothetical protein [Acrocarpospora catenulata]|uniref:hypothetical protein n=1 Tax=Acrocarpospora catenulata TaxID=2836182 RepID=UPI001BD99A2A|nr:hypothetical protein [Acrocarpospora catenulata]